MLDGTREIYQRISHLHCHTHFGQYGLFATLPLRTELCNKDASENSSSAVARAYETLREEYLLRPKSSNGSTILDDSEYITLDDIHFFLLLCGPCTPLDEETVEADRRELVREVKLQRNVIASHAKSLLKAITFWKLNFDDNHAEWARQSRDALDARHIRRSGISGAGRTADDDRDASENYTDESEDDV